VGGHRAVARLVRDNVKVGGYFIGDWLGRLRTQRVDSLVPGEGGIVRHNGMIVGASRDEAGAVHGVSLTCTYLGCTVRWNAAETNLGLPVSRLPLDHDGTVQGPAVRGLRRFNVTVEGR
jgi:Rieske Fe-S protein